MSERRCHQRRIGRRPRHRLTWLLMMIVLATSVFVQPCQAWEWTDYLGGNEDLAAFQTQTLSMDEIREMRVRDIKRRLARTHGFSADELGRMLDKKELIAALSFEEHKDREKELEKVKRYVVVRGIIIALLAVVVVLGWPIWVHVYETASVNFVVYTDRKRHEASRCIELGSFQGMVGVFFMAVVDTLQLWLSLSVMLSWFTSSKYFFPTPNLPFRPAQFMGEKVAKGPMAKYGMNVGPMALTWAFRFAQRQLEVFTGRALSRAYSKQKKEAREWESPEDRAARKAARKAAKRAAKEEMAEKKREAEAEEAKRRKEAADKATEALFPPSMKLKQQALNETTNEEENDFEREMENLDMDDLD